MILGELNEPQTPYLDRALQYMNDSTKGFEQIRMVASSLEELNRTVPAASGWLKDLNAQQNADGSSAKGPERAREPQPYRSRPCSDWAANLMLCVRFRSCNRGNESMRIRR
ncbi:MAG: hypothetical protein U0892_16415 [Pirellulales bacterium]